MSTDTVPRTPITIEDLCTACASVLADTDPTTEPEDYAYMTSIHALFARVAKQHPGASLCDVFDGEALRRFRSDREGTA